MHGRQPANAAAIREIIGLRATLQFVGEAADGDEAVSEATRLQPDVILLDLSMPHRTGLAAILELRSVAPHAKIIVFSGFSEAIAGDTTMELGALLYLPKGASAAAINDAIEYAAAQTGGHSGVRSAKPSY